VVRISRWIASCDCLRIQPSSTTLAPGESTYVRAVFDPAAERDSFVGELRISVEAFADNLLVGEFDVPVSVVTVESMKHLDDLNK
jgi:hypothetical protein